VILRDVAKSLGLEVGCSDSGCIWGAPNEMATNGGCRCVSHVSRTRTTLHNAQALARVAQHLAAEVERLQKWKDAAETTVNAVALRGIEEVYRRLSLPSGSADHSADD
jgi:hypothetical protein